MTPVMTASSSVANVASKLSLHRLDVIMRSCEVRHSRKALAALLGFLARGAATGAALGPRSQIARIELERNEGVRRKVEARLLAFALERGLLTGKPVRGQSPAEAGAGVAAATGQVLVCAYMPTPEGRVALRRWLADPESAFQDQHRTLLTRSDPDHGHLLVNSEESPLAAMARIKGRGGALFLDPCQVEAGERLRTDFTRGHMQPSLGQRWEPVCNGRQAGGPGGVSDLTDAALSARLRVEAALAEVGPELSGVLLDVCCFLKGLAEVERDRQWPARSAKLMLRTALAALARHYASPKDPVRRQSAPPPHAP